MLEKRSLTLTGHRTSLALEPEFWRALEVIAQARAVSLPALLKIIDAQRAATAPDQPLASAARVYALTYQFAARP